MYINSLQEIQYSIQWVKGLRKGYITNFFLDPFRMGLWIKEQKLFSEQETETVFFIRENAGFYTLYYCSTGEVALQYDLSLFFKNHTEGIYVTDIIRNALVNPIKSVFLSCGFSEYTSLMRMNRVGDTRKFVRLALKQLQEAVETDENEILNLLNTFFDPYAEQLPFLEEVRQWLVAGHVLVFREETRILGFIIYDLSGVTLYLRYWFVHPDFRDRRIGSMLFNWFMEKGCKTKRQLFWVLCSNENAIKRYKHYGFVPEKMFDDVLIRN